MLERIFAKSEPPELLTTHTSNAIFIWKKLKERYQSVIKLDDNFWFRSFVAVLLHDAGKVAINFQKYFKI